MLIDPRNFDRFNMILTGVVVPRPHRLRVHHLHRRRGEPGAVQLLQRYGLQPAHGDLLLVRAALPVGRTSARTP